MAGWRSIVEVDMQTYKRQSLKAAMIFVIFSNIALFIFSLITEYRSLIEFSYSISIFKWYQFSVSFLLALVSIQALRAITDHHPFVLQIFTKSNVFLIFISTVIIIFLKFFQSQVVEYLTQKDLRCRSSYRPTKLLVERNLDLIIYQELVRMGWELMSFLVAINYYRTMLEKRTVSIIYTIPQQFITWQDETYTSDRTKSISTSFSQYKLPSYARFK